MAQYQHACAIALYLFKRDSPWPPFTLPNCRQFNLLYRPLVHSAELAAPHNKPDKMPKSRCDISEVSPGVFVGTAAAAANSQLLKEHNITWLLSTCPAANELPLCITHHLNLGLLDESDVDLLGALPEAISFIDRAQEAVAGVFIAAFLSILCNSPRLNTQTHHFSTSLLLVPVSTTSVYIHLLGYRYTNTQHVHSPLSTETCIC